MPINPLSNAGTAGGMLSAAQDEILQERLNKGAGVAKKDTGPSQESSALSVADRSTFSSRHWNPDETIDFSMNTYTRNGTRVQVEAGERAFTMGVFANKGPLENKFNLAGSRAPLDMAVTFTTPDGESETYKITESMTFHETADGRVEAGHADGKSVRDPVTGEMRDETNIIFNMDDGAAVVGGDGDDVMLNFASDAYVNGKEGDDTIVNMGSGTTLKGDEGEDLIKIVKDVIRDEREGTLNLASIDYDGPKGISILGGANPLDINPELMMSSKHGEEVTVDGGDGNDVVDARGTKLERATIKGGAGDDMMFFEDLAASNVQGGEGNDYIEVENALYSTIDGGAGDDQISVSQSKFSTVKGGAGNDHISVDRAADSKIAGGTGDDTIDVGTAWKTDISGGDGNDRIDVGILDNSTLDAGNGDDIINIRQVNSSVVDGGTGKDTITIQTVSDGSYSKKAENSRPSVILGGAGDDYILVGRDAVNSFIFGGDGDDTIVMANASDMIISGGAGDDSIETGRGGGNLIDGGSGKNDIQLNTEAKARELITEKPHPYTEEDVDIEELALLIKQITNSGPEGETLTEEQWIERARERLNKTITRVGGMDPDVVVDNGKLVQGTPNQLQSILDAKMKKYGNSLMNREQKMATKAYLNAMQALAQAEGAQPPNTESNHPVTGIGFQDPKLIIGHLAR